jgi:hypothetical protein
MDICSTKAFVFNKTDLFRNVEAETNQNKMGENM